jgi:hypothetical protein
MARLSEVGLEFHAARAGQWSGPCLVMAWTARL